MSEQSDAACSPQSFGALVEDVVIHGFVALNMAIGARLRLFDALAEACASGPVTSTQLAQQTGLKERYLREWLSGMATAKIVDYDCAKNGFYLAAHKLRAMRESPMITRYFEYAELIPGLGRVHENVIACFPEDGPIGIPYSVCGGLFEWLGRRQPVKFTAELQESLLSHVPGLVAELNRGIIVADFGCGSGGAVNVLARMFPNSSFCGLDIVDECLADARSLCQDVTNATFQKVDICSIPDELRGHFGAIVVNDVLHDLPFPEKLLDAIVLALRPGGWLLLNEVDAHSELKDNMGSSLYATLYCISLHHCLPTSLNTPGGRGLGTCGGTEVYQQMLDSCGLIDIRRVQPKEGGLYFYARKPTVKRKSSS